MDYYIRSWDPDSTYPPNPQEGDVCYTITLDQSWSPVAGVKNDNLLKEEVYENGEWKEVGSGGGGGSSEITVKAVLVGANLPAAAFEDGGTYAYTSMPMGLPNSIDAFPDAVDVAINGTTYSNCERELDGDSLYYGAGPEGDDDFDFSTYPFCIMASDNGWFIVLETMPASDVSLFATYEETYSSKDPEKIVIATGTAEEDEGQYTATISDLNVSDLAGCYIDIAGKTYSLGYNSIEGVAVFGGIGYLYQSDSDATLEAFVGGNFTIYKYELPTDMKWKVGTLGGNTLVMGGSVSYCSCGSADADEDGDAKVTWTTTADDKHRFAENDVVIIKATPQSPNNRAKFTANPAASGCTASILYSNAANNVNVGEAWRIVQLTNVTDGCSISQAVAFAAVSN